MYRVTWRASAIGHELQLDWWRTFDYGFALRLAERLGGRLVSINWEE